MAERRIPGAAQSTSATPTNVSIVLNVHREAPYLTRTLLSLNEAVEFAASYGLATELVVVLDKADERTIHWAQDTDFQTFAAHQVISVANGSLGPSRNDGVAAASSEYIMTCDADDLVSFNMISAMYLKAQEVGRNALVFPNYLLGFGDNPHLAAYFGQGVYSTLSFMSFHPFTSRVLAHRAVFEDSPYLDLKLSDGFAYEDWHFNATAVARGLTLHVAPATVLYYRQRTASLLKAANAVSVNQIPPSDFHQPEVFRARCAADYARHRNGETPRYSAAEVRETFLGNRVILEASRAANMIDAAIDISLLEHQPAFSNLDGDLELGAAYFELSSLLIGRTFTDVVLLPYLTTGGGEKYILNVVDALATLDPARAFLVVTGQGGVRHEWLDRLPPNSLFLDIHNRFEMLDAQALELLTLRIIQTVASDADLHLKSSLYAVAFFNRFGRVLPRNRAIFYRFSDQVVIFQGVNMTRGFAFNFMSDNIDQLDLIIADNKSILAEDRRKLTVNAERWSTLYTHCDLIANEVTVRARSGFKGRVLWASRLDPEKRPELLAEIAARLHLYRPDLQIDVWGKSFFGGDTDALSRQPNVRLRGEFWKFADINPEDYDLFLYTTAYDGLPNVVLEALSAGLPVVAPSVGGLAEAVSEDTGLLVEDDPDSQVLVQRYVEAILHLYADEARLRHAGLNALQLIRERHSRCTFLRRVAEIFGLPAPC